MKAVTETKRLLQKLLVLICIWMVHVSFNGRPTQAPGRTATGSVTIEVVNLKGSKGSVLLSLFNNSRHFPNEAEKAVGKLRVKITDGKAVASFDALPYGRYAVAILHDENDNLKMDFNLVGLPKEGYGFSNNVEGTFGPPSFNKAAFPVDAAENKITIRASYFFK